MAHHVARLIGLVPSTSRPIPSPLTPVADDVLALLTSQSLSLSSHEAYFVLCAWLSELKKSGADLPSERWELLRTIKSDNLAPSARACYYPPSVCKVLDILSHVVESEAFSSSESLAQEILALLQAIKGLGKFTPLPSPCDCKLIDASLTTQLNGGIVVLSHRLVNQTFRYHGSDLGQKALDSLFIVQQSFAQNLSLLCSNDCWVISYLLDRLEIYLRLLKKQLNTKTDPSAVLGELNPLVAHLCFLTACGFNESFWIDLMSSQETRALEYMLRVTQLLTTCEPDAWASACREAYALDLTPPARETKKDGLLGSAQLSAVWEVTTGSQKATSSAIIAGRDWEAWAILPAPVVSGTEPLDIAISATAFYRRLSLHLKQLSGRRCLSFNPHILCSRLDAFTT